MSLPFHPQPKRTPRVLEREAKLPDWNAWAGWEKLLNMLMNILLIHFLIFFLFLVLLKQL